MIVKLNTVLAVCFVGVDESSTVKVKLLVPTVSNPGVPLILPVDGSRLSPAGSAGSTDQVKGATPPERFNVVP